MLEFRNVSCRDKGAVLQKFSMTFEREGGVTALICPKYQVTEDLVGILTARVPISNGVVRLDGRDYFSRPSDMNVSFILGEPVVYRQLSVLDNVFMNRKSYSLFTRKKTLEECRRLLSEFEIPVRERQSTMELSYEELRLIEILRCYVEKPALLILHGVNTSLTLNVFPIFKRVLDRVIGNGTQVILLSNLIEEAIKLADTVILYNNGKIYGTYKTEAIEKNPARFNYLMLGGDELELKGAEPGEETLKWIEKIEKNVFSLSAGYDLTATAKTFGKSLTETIGADNCVVYTVDEKHNSVIHVKAFDNFTSVPVMSTEALKEVVSFDNIRIMKPGGEESVRYFGGRQKSGTICCIGYRINDNEACLIELYYDSEKELSENDERLLRLTCRELARILENAKLLGQSVLLHESHHRIKNNLQMIISMIEMERDGTQGRFAIEDDSRLFGSVIDSIIGRVESIAETHNLLLQNDAIRSSINLHDILDPLMRFYKDEAEFSVTCKDVMISYNKAVSLALVINELMNNSVKYNNNKRPVSIDLRVEREGDRYVFDYHDNGCGFPENLTPEHYGIGMTIIESIICYELGGELSFENDCGARSCFKIDNVKLL